MNYLLDVSVSVDEDVWLVVAVLLIIALIIWIFNNLRR